jgi:hypothetical protein
MDKRLSLSDLRRQRAEIAQEIEEARARLGVLMRRLAHLEAAEEMVAEFGQDVSEQETPAARPRSMPVVHRSIGAAPMMIPMARPRMAGGGTITTKDLIVTVLRQMPKVWTTANEIQTRVSELKGEEVPMSTISPYLTTLKNDEIIVRNGMRIALKERAPVDPDSDHSQAPEEEYEE